MEHVLRGFAWFGVVFFLLGLGQVRPLFASEPKYTNAHPTYKPLTPSEEKRLTPIKLGKTPKLSKADMKKIGKGEVVVRDMGGKGENHHYEAIASINAKPSTVMDFLRDYPARVGRIPHVTAIEAQWNGNMVTVDMKLKVAFLSASYTLSFLHYGNSYIEWEYVKGDIRNTTGFYKLFPYAKGKKTLLVYQVSTDIGLPVPTFIMKMLTKSSMPDVLLAVRKASLERKK